MALAECIECGGSCSENAETCPHCGEPEPARSALDDAAWKFCGVVFTLIFLGLLGFGLYAAFTGQLKN